MPLHIPTALSDLRTTAYSALEDKPKTKAPPWYRSAIIAVAQAMAIAILANTIAQIILCVKSGQWSYDILQTLRFMAMNLCLLPPNYFWAVFIERTWPTYPGTQRPGEPGNGSQTRRKDSVDYELADYRDSVEDPSSGVAGSTSATTADNSPASKSPTQIHVVNVGIKLVLDAFTFGALFNVLIILVVLGFLKGETGSEVAGDLRTRLLPMIVDSYKLWPLAMIIAYLWIPVEKRIVWYQFIGLIWGTYVSIVAA